MTTTAATVYRWWVLENTTPQGPYSVAYLQIRLKQGALTADSLVCPEGGSEWHPIRRWPEFNAWSAPPPSIPLPPPIPPAIAPFKGACPTLLGFEATFVLQTIEVYVFFVSPAIFLIGSVSCVALPPTFHPQSPYFGLEFLISLGGFVGDVLIVGLLIAAGLKLRQKKRNGAQLLCIGFGINSVFAVISIVFSVLLSAAAASDSQINHFYPEESSPAATLFSLAMFFAIFAAAVFQIAVWIWTAVNFRNLPLED